MKIWLDDIRPAPAGWKWARNVVALRFYIACGEKVEEISLDHDLGEGCATGYDFLNEMEKDIVSGYWSDILGHKNIPVFHIHSANPVGRANMKRAIDSISRLSL